mmetsp:Transcript_20763/g.49326  ORF Transcript_20763/g.49326 Transcript_20763/m.49326 type:complete len:263 (-) Transcript_20763:97-885(-)
MFATTFSPRSTADSARRPAASSPRSSSMAREVACIPTMPAASARRDAALYETALRMGDMARWYESEMPSSRATSSPSCSRRSVAPPAASRTAMPRSVVMASTSSGTSTVAAAAESTCETVPSVIGVSSSVIAASINCMREVRTPVLYLLSSPFSAQGSVMSLSIPARDAAWVSKAGPSLLSRRFDSSADRFASSAWSTAPSGTSISIQVGKGSSPRASSASETSRCKRSGWHTASVGPAQATAASPVGNTVFSWEVWTLTAR